MQLQSLRFLWERLWATQYMHLHRHRGVKWQYSGCVSEPGCFADGIWYVLLRRAPQKGWERAARKKVAFWPFPHCWTSNKLQNQREKENDIALFLRSHWTCPGESAERVRRARGGGESLQQGRHCRAWSQLLLLQPCDRGEQFKEANPSVTSGWLQAFSQWLRHNNMDFASTSLQLAFTPAQSASALRITSHPASERSF